MAQDFYQAFGLGTSDKSITTVDADGISLAAIKGLLDRIEQLESENNELKAKVSSTDEQMASVLDRLSKLEQSNLNDSKSAED